MGEAADIRLELELPGPRRRILITGAEGTIGGHLMTALAADHDLVLGHHPDAESDRLAEHGETCALDLLDLDSLRSACNGVDTVIHLAARAAPDTPWAAVRDDNITGTYQLFAAAIDAGCRRVVFASSIHAVSGYPEGRQVHPEDPVCPGDIYGVSKCFGEAMARYAATQHGLSAICIRIGAFQPAQRAADPEALPLMDAFVSERDLCQLVRRAVADETIRFAIVHGCSGNRFNRLDIGSARALLGYEPQDDFTRDQPGLAELDLAERVEPHDERHSDRPGGMREELDRTP